MPVLGFNDFADVTENGRRIEPRHNRSVGISVDRGFLYINDNAFVTGCAGFSGAVLMSSGTEMFWGEGVGAQGYTGIQGPTGPAGAPQGETGAQGITGLGNFTQKNDFNDSTNVPEIMWNFQDESFYGFVTGVNKWIQISSGSVAGPTGLQGATGTQGATGIRGLQGYTGLRGFTGAQGATGIPGVTGAQGATLTNLYSKFISDQYSFTGSATGMNVIPDFTFTGIINGNYILECSLGVTGVSASTIYMGVTGISTCYLYAPANGTSPLTVSALNSPTNYTTTSGIPAVGVLYLKGTVTIDNEILAIKISKSGTVAALTSGSYATLTKVS